MKAVILLYLPPQQSSECAYNLKDFFLNGLKEQKSYTNWLIVKYIYAVQSIKVNTFPWTILFSYILISPRHPWKQKSLWLYTSSEKQMFLQAISFSLSPSHPLSPPPPLFFNEIFIKISFSAQAQRQVTLQSWDKMKLLTDKMSIQIHTLVLRKKLATLCQDICNEGDILLSSLIKLFLWPGFHLVCVHIWLLVGAYWRHNVDPASSV